MLKYWLWLAELKGLNNQIRLALLHHFSTPEDVFYADEAEILLVEGMTREQAALLQNHNLSATDRILADCQRLDLRLLTLQDAEYPHRLRNIYDPPCLLYIRGRLPVLDEEAAVAVVGTRDCTPYGVACAEKLGSGVTDCGGVVVSGLAKGIDAAAIRGALRAGGRPICVLGNGVDVAYPWENRYLYEDVASTGALISEYPPGTEAAGRHFPVRNRILAGLCVATVVVEAPLHSGALITAGTALEQGRDIFAVPGPIDAPTSAGCNQLLREGAGVAAEAWDILQGYETWFPGKLHRGAVREEIPILGYRARQQTEAKPVAPSLRLADHMMELTDDQIRLLRVLTEEPQLVDDLMEQTGIPTRRILSALTVLEIEHLVIQHSGKRYTRAVTLVE
jgi:DNA processing protein